jgi:hypothetical protein
MYHISHIHVKKKLGVGKIFKPLDILPHSAIIPTEIRSPIPWLGGRLWLGFRKPHFLIEVGFFATILVGVLCGSI